MVLGASWNTTKAVMQGFPRPEKPTRGLEPRTPSLRVTAEEGSESPPVPPGPMNEPKPETAKDSEEPEGA